MNKVILGVILGVVLMYVVVPVSTNVSERTATSELTAQDYAEIEQLYWRYNHGSDFRDAELFLSAFADDAIFKTGPEQEYVGMDELAALRVERHAGKTGDNGSRHWNSSNYVKKTTEGAVGKVYWVVFNVSSGTPTVRVSGFYDDVYVKTNTGWKIKSRTIVRDGA